MEAGTVLTPDAAASAAVDQIIALLPH
jgi:hypothetical protein